MGGSLWINAVFTLFLGLSWVCKGGEGRRSVRGVFQKTHFGSILTSVLFRAKVSYKDDSKGFHGIIDL